MKYLVILVDVLLLTFSLSVGDARPVKIWSYSDLMKESALIIIATHEKTSDTEDKGELGGTKVVGVDSTFKVLSALKGKVVDGKVTVHHYKYDKSPTGDKSPIGVVNGCGFISFPEDDKNAYLIFLKEDENKNIVPVTGQYDSVDSFKVVSNARER